MVTYAQAIEGVLSFAYANGSPWAAGLADMIAKDMAEWGYEQSKPLNYQPGKTAYCKYCYEHHKKWWLSQDHWRPAWICQLCNHATADERMEIE